MCTSIDPILLRGASPRLKLSFAIWPPGPTPHPPYTTLLHAVCPGRTITTYTHSTHPSALQQQQQPPQLCLLAWAARLCQLRRHRLTSPLQLSRTVWCVRYPLSAVRPGYPAFHCLSFSPSSPLGASRVVTPSPSLVHGVLVCLVDPIQAAPQRADCSRYRIRPPLVRRRLFSKGTWQLSSHHTSTFQLNLSHVLMRLARLVHRPIRSMFCPPTLRPLLSSTSTDLALGDTSSLRPAAFFSSSCVLACLC